MTLCDRVPKLNKCCFCVDLRLGGIVLGVFYLIGSIALVGSVSWTLTTIDKGNENYPVSFGGTIFTLVVACIQVLLAIMLLLGICTKRQHLMLPYLWLQFINIVLYLAAGVAQIFFFWEASIGTLIGGCKYFFCNLKT